MPGQRPPQVTMAMQVARRVEKDVTARAGEFDGGWIDVVAHRVADGVEMVVEDDAVTVGVPAGAVGIEVEGASR